MKDVFNFEITHSGPHLSRAGVYNTPHGKIYTPAFVTVGTKATVKGLTPEMIKDLGAQVFLANTYHLYLAPGDEQIARLGALHQFTGWYGPMMTDSGGFQVLSLGAAFGTNVSKIAKDDSGYTQSSINENTKARARISEDGVEFRSIRDGSLHFFTPEKSMQIQQNLGADIYFAFDECTSPQADYGYQVEAMNRTHRWAKRSLDEHQRLEALKGNSRPPQALFGVVQGGRHPELRKESAELLGSMDFDGFGIGGSFDKDDMESAVGIACAHLPKDKPRHLLGIGEPIDLFLGVEQGIDLFDCVAPTRMARHGGVHTRDGKINLKSKDNRSYVGPIDAECGCYACKRFSRAYIAHLLREKEMLGATLASIHNLYFINHLVADIRQSIIDEKFYEFKNQFLNRYYDN
ncbi:MAG: tRNA guanosine(34) transglycosylase Tgt [Patescibacteria group bacterium]